jgi:hypothetical protein
MANMDRLDAKAIQGHWAKMKLKKGRRRIMMI